MRTIAQHAASTFTTFSESAPKHVADFFEKNFLAAGLLHAEEVAVYFFLAAGSFTS